MTRTINGLTVMAQVTTKLNSAPITPQQPQTQTSKLNIQKTIYTFRSHSTAKIISHIKNLSCLRIYSYLQIRHRVEVDYSK